MLKTTIFSFLNPFFKIFENLQPNNNLKLLFLSIFKKNKN